MKYLSNKQVGDANFNILISRYKQNIKNPVIKRT